eukprot:g40014.t1
MFFGNWTDHSFIPFTVRTDYLKVLGIWFGGVRVCTKSWEERIAKVKQKLVHWEHCSLSIVVTRAIWCFIRKPKIDQVCRDSMYKTLAKGRRNIPNVALILMATFVCGCIRLCVDLQYTNTKCYDRLKFYLSPVLQRMGVASLLQNIPSSWTVPYHLSFVKKFAKKNTVDHKSIRKWSAHSVLKTLWEKERVDPVTWFPEQTVKVIWQKVLSPELSNKHQDIALLVDSVLYSLFPGMHSDTNIDCAWRIINSVKDALWSTRNLLVFQNKELTLTELLLSHCREVDRDLDGH